MQLPEGALQRLDFSFVRDFLPLNQFQGFEHVFHFVEHVLQLLDDFGDLLD
jgi:hypothetical protein